MTLTGLLILLVGVWLAFCLLCWICGLVIGAIEWLYENETVRFTVSVCSSIMMGAITYSLFGFDIPEFTASGIAAGVILHMILPHRR